MKLPKKHKRQNPKIRLRKESLPVLVRRRRLDDEVSASKTLKRPNARLERLLKLKLRRQGVEFRHSDKKVLNASFAAAIRRDTEICKKRKIRRAQIMAKSRGRGLRVRNTHWTLDSYIQC